MWESAAVFWTLEAVTVWIGSWMEGLTRYRKKLDLEAFDKRYAPSINSNSVTFNGHLHFPINLLLKGGYWLVVAHPLGPGSGLTCWWCMVDLERMQMLVGKPALRKWSHWLFSGE